jgi:hypothetical protein
MTFKTLGITALVLAAAVGIYFAATYEKTRMTWKDEPPALSLKVDDGTLPVLRARASLNLKLDMRVAEGDYVKAAQSWQHRRDGCSGSNPGIDCGMATQNLDGWLESMDKDVDEAADQLKQDCDDMSAGDKQKATQEFESWRKQFTAGRTETLKIQ